MNIKSKIRKSFIFYLFVYLRYLITRFLFNKQFRNYTLTKNITLRKIGDGITFFGYYNISPISKDGEVLYLKAISEKIRASRTDKVSIYLLNDKDSVLIDEGVCWNWQQGNMLQWIPSSNRKIIYNNYDDLTDNYYSILRDLDNNTFTKLEKPIYSVSKCGKFALTLSYERLSVMRPDYGYFNKKNNNLLDDDYDGIWRINLLENESELIISLNTLKNFSPSTTMVNALHKVNHIDIAPDGKRFMFLHRWVGPKGRFMRLITANCEDGSDLFYVTGDKMVSHNCWWGNDQIISFCRIDDSRNGYVHFNDKVGMVNIIGMNDFYNDGHPSVSPDGRWMLTDDYPDISRFAGLYLFDLKESKKYTIGKFYQPLRYKGEKRIDLHPKWSPDGKYVSIDSGHSGRRMMYILNVDEIVSAKRQ